MPKTKKKPAHPLAEYAAEIQDAKPDDNGRLWLYQFESGSPVWSFIFRNGGNSLAVEKLRKAAGLKK